MTPQINIEKALRCLVPRHFGRKTPGSLWREIAVKNPIELRLQQHSCLGLLYWDKVRIRTQGVFKRQRNSKSNTIG